MRHGTLQRAIRQLPPIQPDYIPFEGGLDLITPPLSVPAGRLRESQNWEIGINEGYDLIEGYEIYDGRAKPSDAIYYIMSVTVSGELSLNDTITGTTSAATGVIIALPSATSVVFTKLTGTFNSSEDLEVSAVVEATTTSSANDGSASTVKLNAQYLNLAADEYRDDIAAVTGSGAILGLTLLNDVTYAFRANAGGTAVDIYKSSSSGWTIVALGREMAFTSGGTTEITEGQTITGATSAATAVVTRVALETGSWVAGTAAGKFTFASQTGTFQSENINVGASANLATIASDSTAITLSAGGRFVFYRYNFGDGLRIYGCDGVNRGFEFDGTVFTPIKTGMTTDTPNYVWAHKNHLFFAFAGSVQHSGIKTPYAWSVITGAAELLIGDNISGFSTEGGSETGGALAIYARNSIHILYGTSSSDWNMIKLKDEVGARPHSIQQAVHSYFLDDRGISRLFAVQKFGNFDHSAVSQLLQSWVIERKGTLNDSCIVRDKNQIRMFFNDKYAIYITIRGGKPVGMMPILFADIVKCVYSHELADGSEQIMFGSDDGKVYELDKGTSLDGDNIVSFLVSHYHHSKSPRRNKSYIDATLEISGLGYGEITLGYDLGYAIAVVPQPDSSTNVVTFSSTQWDNFTWDSFFWDGTTLQPTVYEMDGTAENVSFSIRTDSDYFLPIKISGAYFHFRYRDRLRFAK